MLIFVGSFQNFRGSKGQNNYQGLINVQNSTFGWMGNIFLQSYLDSIIPNTQVSYKKIDFFIMYTYTYILLTQIYYHDNISGQVYQHESNQAYIYILHGNSFGIS